MDALTQGLRAELRMRRAERGRFRAFAAGVATATVAITLLLVAAVAHGAIPREAARYQRDLIREARAVWGVHAPIATLAAQIHQESMWRHDARSRVGALGLAQFMPATSRWISGLYADLGINEPMNPRWALRAQSRYMRFLWDRVDGINDCERWAFALAGYNGGHGWTLKRKALSPDPGRCLGLTCEINPGIHPMNQRENSRYAKLILLLHSPAYAEAGWGREMCPNYAWGRDGWL